MRRQAREAPLGTDAFLGTGFRQAPLSAAIKNMFIVYRILYIIHIMYTMYFALYDILYILHNA